MMVDPTWTNTTVSRSEYRRNLRRSAAVLLPVLLGGYGVFMLGVWQCNPQMTAEDIFYLALKMPFLIAWLAPIALAKWLMQVGRELGAAAAMGVIAMIALFVFVLIAIGAAKIMRAVRG